MTSKGRIFDYRLDTKMRLQVNEYNETVQWWRDKIRELQANGKNVSYLKSKLNKAIKTQLGES